MRNPSAKVIPFLLCVLFFLHVPRLLAEPVPVRHVEGLTHGFLVLRDLSGKIIAHGELDEVLNPADGVVTNDVRFSFEDGSFYEEVTKFTQRRQFRLVHDKIVQKGPSFKQHGETEIDAAAGSISVRTTEDGKEKVTNKHMNFPTDLSNGMLPVLLKNLVPTKTETTVSMVSTSSSPRIVQLHIFPEEEKTLKFGALPSKTLHYVLKVKIGGLAGTIAPLVGKQPPDIHMWVTATAAPTFLQSEGPLSEGNPVWRIQISAPDEKLLDATR